jgi:hypothetical protein
MLTVPTTRSPCPDPRLGVGLASAGSSACSRLDCVGEAVPAHRTVSLRRDIVPAPSSAMSSSSSDPPHPFLMTQNPSALSDSLLPILTKDWPAACVEMAKAAEAAPPRQPDANSLVSGMQLPLLRHDEVVQCSNCKRMLLREALEKHKVTCMQLPIAELLAADAAVSMPASSHNKSPNRDRPPSASGRASGARPSGSACRHALARDGSPLSLPVRPPAPLRTHTRNVCPDARARSRRWRAWRGCGARRQRDGRLARAIGWQRPAAQRAPSQPRRRWRRRRPLGRLGTVGTTSPVGGAGAPIAAV